MELMYSLTLEAVTAANESVFAAPRVVRPFVFHFSL
jgi:hypothetical protein